MRTATKSGITLKYPDALGFAFNPCLLVAEGTEYMIINITDGVTVQNVTYRGINGSTFADIRSWVQSFFDENTFEQLNYSQSLQQVATGKRLSVVVTVRGGGSTVQFDPFTVFYVWGAMKIGGQEVFNGYRKLKYFANYPFTLGVYASGATNIVFGTASAVQVTGAGMWNVKPVIGAGYDRVLISDYNGTIEQATFDTTFDLSFMLASGGSQQVIGEIEIDRQTNEGYYLRWLNRHGFWCYWLFKEGAGSYKSQADGEFWRNNLLDYTQAYGYQGGAVRRQSYIRTETIPVCVPLVDRQTWEYLLDITSSPLVDLYTGTVGNVPQWVSVSVVAGSTTRDMKSELQDFVCQIQMPEIPTQRL